VIVVVFVELIKSIFMSTKQSQHETSLLYQNWPSPQGGFHTFHQDPTFLLLRPPLELLVHCGSAELIKVVLLDTQCASENKALVNALVSNWLTDLICYRQTIQY